MNFLQLLEKMVDYVFACLPRKTPQHHQSPNACLIAHRGAHSRKRGIIENTDAAFSAALAVDCWGIEFDVHATADQVLVVNHDPTLKRIWGKNVAINTLTFKQLRQLAPQIMSLAEVVERYGKRLHLFIELKAPFNAESSLYQDLSTLTPSVDYHLLSLCESVFASLRSFPLETMLLVAVHNNVTHFSSLCLQKHYGGVLGHYLLFNNTKINRLKEAKKLVGVGMIDSRFALYRELNRGLQWIFSNKVMLLSRSLKKLQ